MRGKAFAQLFGVRTLPEDYEVNYMNTELYLTDNCNMQCSFCGSWNQKDVSNNLQLEDIKKYLTELHNRGYRYLSLSGGEPFLYENLYEVIEFANHKGFMLQRMG